MKNEAKFQISGRIVEVGSVKTFASGFTKRELIVETSSNDKWPSPVKVTLKKDDCAKGDALNVGDGVTIDGYIEGRRWDGPSGTAYFTDLSARSIMVAEKTAPAEGGDGLPTDWPSFLAFARELGLDEDAAKKRCADYKAANAITRRFTAAEWKAVAVDMSNSSEYELDDCPF